MHNVEVSASQGHVRVVDLESCDLLLRVSNQSFLDDPVVLTVWFDGVEVLSQPFEVRNQHTYVHFPLRLGPGTHQVKVSSDTGVVIEEQFMLPASGERQYAGIGYFNYADEDGKLIEWAIQLRPMVVK